MRILTHIGEYETKRSDDNEHLAGCVEVLNRAPKDLEDPNCPQTALRYDVFLVDTDNPDPNSWNGCRVFWDEKEWLITASLSVENGNRALIEIEQLPHYLVHLYDLWEGVEVEVRTPADDKTHAGVVARNDLGNYSRYKVLKVEGPMYYEKVHPKWTDAKKTD